VNDIHIIYIRLRFGIKECTMDIGKSHKESKSIHQTLIYITTQSTGT
jgi:hypothetical protein